ncbi:TetR/AcrR family transcriptional regulator [Humibacter albus]|uniref:TetR/AcrR family transcriptional regulator n=1 Tax=Humibacter albus TaxID=427754 RepID=UPI0003B63E46|nr:TetR/AcrR family transcriptional regulator [Humibacter albus]
MTTDLPRARAPRRDAAENRAALLEAAVRLLNDDVDASLESIAAEAGLSRRAVYGHFATRDDLVREVLTRGAARMAASILPISHQDARIEIALYGATLWREVQHARVTAEFALRGPHIDMVSHSLEPARAKLRDTVRRGVKAGQLRRDIRPDVLARLIERSAIDVLTEATHDGLSARAGHRLVMLTALSMAGLGWLDADDVVSHAPELAFQPARGGVPASGAADAPDDSTGRTTRGATIGSTPPGAPAEDAVRDITRENA